jgi:hypothetical protein
MTCRICSPSSKLIIYESLSHSSIPNVHIQTRTRRASLANLALQLDRMPPQIGDFISEQVYDGDLLSHSGHVVPSSAIACRFVDVNGSEQLDQDGKSLLVGIALAFWGERAQAQAIPNAS